MISYEEIMKLLQSCVSDCLKPVGFKKKNRTWRYKSIETISLFNIQKSNWGRQYYFNIGAYVPHIEEHALDSPSVADLHFWWRLEALVKLDEQFGMPLSISTHKEDIASKLSILREAILNVALPILIAMRTVNGIWQIKKQYPVFLVKSPLIFYPPFSTDKK